MFEVIPNRPDARGRFGKFGGRFVPEVLMPAHLELEQAYAEARRDPTFAQDYARLLRDVRCRKMQP